jgi:hypothetical protein
MTKVLQRGVVSALLVALLGASPALAQGTGGGSKDSLRDVILDVRDHPPSARYWADLVALYMQPKYVPYWAPGVTYGYLDGHATVWDESDPARPTVLTSFFGRFLVTASGDGVAIDDVEAAVLAIDWSQLGTVVDPGADVPPAADDPEPPALPRPPARPPFPTQEVDPNSPYVDRLLDKLGDHLQPDDPLRRQVAQEIAEAVHRMRALLQSLGFTEHLSLDFPAEIRAKDGKIVPAWIWSSNGHIEITGDMQVWIDGKHRGDQADATGRPPLDGLASEWEWASYAMRRAVAHEFWHGLQRVGGEDRGTWANYGDNPWEMETHQLQDDLVELLYPEGVQGHREVGQSGRTEYFQDVVTDYDAATMNDWTGASREELPRAFRELIRENMAQLESFWQGVTDDNGQPWDQPKHLEWIKQRLDALDALDRAWEEYAQREAEIAAWRERERARDRLPTISFQPQGFGWEDIAVVFPDEVQPGLPRIEVHGMVAGGQVTSTATYAELLITPAAGSQPGAGGGDAPGDNPGSTRLSPWAKFQDGAFARFDTVSRHNLGESTSEVTVSLLSVAGDRVNRRTRNVLPGQVVERDEQESIPVLLRSETITVGGTSYACDVWRYFLYRESQTGERVVWLEKGTEVPVQMTTRQEGAAVTMVLNARDVPVQVGSQTVLCTELTYSGTEGGFPTTRTAHLSPSVPGGLVQQITEQDTMSPAGIARSTMSLVEFGGELR